jgi:hypothetical protein
MSPVSLEFERTAIEVHRRLEGLIEYVTVVAHELDAEPESVCAVDDYVVGLLVIEPGDRRGTRLVHHCVARDEPVRFAEEDGVVIGGWGIGRLNTGDCPVRELRRQLPITGSDGEDAAGLQETARGTVHGRGGGRVVRDLRPEILNADRTAAGRIGVRVGVGV